MMPPLDPAAALLIARDPRSPPDLLRGLASREEPAVLEALASNPNTPLDLLLELAASYPTDFLANPALELFEMEAPGRLVRGVSAEAALSLLGQDQIPTWMIRPLLSHPDFRVAHRLRVAAASASPAVLQQIAAYDSPVVRGEVAGNPALPGEALARLAGDASPEVRAAVARATSDPALLDRLGRDPHPSPRLFARSRAGRQLAAGDERAAARRWQGIGHTSPRQRDRNETCAVSLALPGADLALVVDSAGGEASGARAVEITRQEICAALEALLPVAAANEVLDCLGAAIAAAHEALCRARKEPQPVSTSTTLAVLLICEDQAHLGHIGDARIYRFRGETVAQLTRDQNPLSDFFDGAPGVVEEDVLDYFTHDTGTQAIGRYFKAVLPGLKTLPIERGDTFLVGTGGLGSTPPGAMHYLLKECGGERAARSLVEAAGSWANGSAIVVTEIG